ncbi:MAG TPA: 2-hydroxychromene-2-carboxylate isomerase [Steroidobacteraceae bacterium]|jgi:2-hydroxychromene-2-carboxylate isomerase
MPVDAAWYFDPLSPYVYLQLPDLERLPPEVRLRPVPVLLAALLKHWGTKGPAELPSKRLHTYRQCVWLARSRGLPFRMPPRHPFNPLGALRLLCALGPSLEQARIASRFVFQDGGDPSTEEGLRELGRRLQVEKVEALAAAPSAKDRLRANTDEAIAHRVWGVPTLRFGEELFWGADSFPMVLDYLADPDFFATPEMNRLATLPIGAARA